ncbi:hypothetical protein JAAARDRAFT_135255 [Jaapia argillacea MUCL 33604]|uniref:Amino acid transporter transmembrane domain-containing protein n=1 Tax=Jaapia argillacea MUCL 33604 TaxID=933084 RepID=A0A067PIP0_9AGAM|nr:hypothetical protein JAAARDRAFT_135255 [Jaapia argillacea MUCL 33604]
MQNSLELVKLEGSPHLCTCTSLLSPRQHSLSPSLPAKTSITRISELQEKGTKTPSLSSHEEEIITARRALRTAGWTSVFYLITTDILGPFNAPYAFSQVGYVPGVILYVVMGAVACYTGLILWRLFVKLDSDRYPVKTYADLAERIFGKWFKHLCTVLQSIQLIIIVGTICLSNAQSIEQIATNNKICFSIAILIWALVGMVIGQIRTLKSYTWLANSSVWLNLIVIFASMGFVAHSPPNYASAAAAYGPAVASGPIQRSAFVSLPISAKVNGIMNMVYAYGGAMIFPERVLLFMILVGMIRPMDFWKGMVCAQMLICTVYMLYGVFVYAFQGQYTLPLAFQGVSRYAWQTMGNVIVMITGIFAAGLLGNIGIKIAYISIVEDWVGGPPLMSRKGRFIWTGMVILYWALAYIVGSAIPQVQTISSLVAAICIMQFTYTFPPLFLLGFDMVVDAAKNDPGDSWTSLSRWKRAMFSGRWWFKLFNFVLFLGSLTLAGLGLYGAVMVIKVTFENGAATSFSCASPV